MMDSAIDFFQGLTLRAQMIVL
ncbi:MAG: hypothetical protein JWL69_382, partial [Phycisphaerales bacterium]|nr:hypothetical protein [Phycisphaerales bacterium]